MTDLATWSVLHLFLKIRSDSDPKKAAEAIRRCEDSGQSVIAVATAGHKSDIGLMCIGTDFLAQRQLQLEMKQAGYALPYSFVSRTEISEYASTIPEQMKEARLNPQLPPENLTSFCFYPMSKRREPSYNWYLLDYDERLQNMMEHGKSGKAFRGRVLQLVTGSVGLDDFEWGVTLFGKEFDDIKECVYKMRFDGASAKYAEFGPFYTGLVLPMESVFI
ncbi:MAG: chlorite dismutase family protein [Firmicutes bacterium]|jgi:chlorite dismutase|nr:chlorite dismutase family protein [Bacillota bacterium]